MLVFQAHVRLFQHYDQIRNVPLIPSACQRINYEQKLAFDLQFRVLCLYVVQEPRYRKIIYLLSELRFDEHDNSPQYRHVERRADVLPQVYQEVYNLLPAFRDRLTALHQQHLDEKRELRPAILHFICRVY